MAQALLQVRDLHAGYGRAEVLTGLAFELPRGSVVTVIGPNGAGKSTTLNALMGLLPARGQIVFDGQDVADTTLEERVMLGLALVPEKRELFGTMPVEDNLVLGGYRPMKLRMPDWRKGLERVYGLFPRLKERRAQLAVTLSGGERQMLAIGRALMAKPKLLMLDEPAAGLRHKEKQALADVLRQLKSEGMSLLLVEHDMEFVMGLTDRIVVMEFGTRLMEGTPAEVQASPQVRAAYLGTEH